jgi:hypothetical protein
MTHTLRILGILLLTAVFAVAAPAWKAQSIRLTWQDNTTTETAFMIERSTDGLNFYPLGTVAANVVTFLDTGLSPRTYHYRVYAIIGSDRTGASNVASVVVKK